MEAGEATITIKYNPTTYSASKERAIFYLFQITQGIGRHALLINAFMILSMISTSMHDWK